MTLIESFPILLALLFVKHFVADGPLQTPYQLAYKGVWIHPGGLLHSGVHVGLSALCIMIWGVLFAPADASFATIMAATAILLLPFEFVVHYLVDYGKCAIEANHNWSRVELTADGARRIVIEDCDAYFVAFLADQLAHALTMIAMVAMLAACLV